MIRETSDRATAPLPLLEIRELEKRYIDGRRVIHAVRRVTLSIHRGETMALVGESGSGKTTIARIIAGLTQATGGEIRYEGRDLLRLPRNERKAMRKQIQMVFQDPLGSLNPRMSVGATLREPFVIHRLAERRNLEDRVTTLLESVGLSGETTFRFPHELSGGQRQRVGIARALALEPNLVIADEPVSALDVSIRAQIVNLLREFQERLGLTYLFIAHDLALVKRISHRVAVMMRGMIVETAPTEMLFRHPRHPYTRRLLAAAPGCRLTMESQIEANPGAESRCLKEWASSDRDTDPVWEPLTEIAPNHYVAEYPGES